MSEITLNKEDLELGWSRLKNDQGSRTFIEHPYEIQLIENDFKIWIATLLQDFNEGNFNPSSLYISDVPKSNGLIRTGSHLSIKDALIYNSLIGLCLDKLIDSLKWSRGNVDFSYQLNPEPNKVKWLKNRFNCWNEFRKNSLDSISDQVEYVIIADITGYYDNIDISTLSSDLRQISISNAITGLLSKYLNKWSITDGRGIPQGYSASDILAKLYLNSIDLHFNALDYKYLRYVDDVRIFCNNLSQARSALIELSNKLKQRGLSLQSSKTRIYSAKKAKGIIDGVHPTLVAVRDEFIEDVKGFLDSIGPYASIADIDEELKDEDIEDSIEILKRAFNDHIIKNENNFDTTLFHFLLNRLGNLKSDYAKIFCIKLLYEMPEETDAVIGYFLKITAMVELQDEILEFMKSDIAVYNYQKYKILNAYLVSEVDLNEKLVNYIRKQAFNKLNPWYLKSICIALLKDYSTIADLEKFESDYKNVRSDIEHAEIIIGLKNLEKGRRNNFFKQVETDGFYTRNAIELIKNQSI